MVYEISVSDLIALGSACITIGLYIAMMKNVTSRVTNIEKDLDLIKEDIKENSKDIAVLENSIKSAHKRIDEI